MSFPQNGSTGAAGPSGNMLVNNVFSGTGEPIWLPYQGATTYNAPSVICSTINGLTPSGGFTGTNNFTGATGPAGPFGPPGPTSAGVQGPQGPPATTALRNYASAYFAPTTVPGGKAILLAQGLSSTNGQRYLLTVNGILTYPASGVQPQDWFQLCTSGYAAVQQPNTYNNAQTPIVNVNTANSSTFPTPVLFINMSLVYTGQGPTNYLYFLYNFANPSGYTLQIFNISTQPI